MLQRYVTLVLGLLVSTSAFAQSHSVYRLAARNLTEPPSVIASRLTADADAAGARVLSDNVVGVPAECGFEGRVLTILDEGYAESLMAVNALTGPYAALDRLVVFADSRGTHVAYVNPPAIARTILLDSPAGMASGIEHERWLREIALADGQSPESYGPRRERGLIGKTMGVMAGGPFDEKIQVHGTLDHGDWSTVADAVEQAFATPGSRWGLRMVHRSDFPERALSILGISGTAMESRSFEIVGAGSNKARKGLACAGLAHAAAYPLEVVVRQDGAGVRVEFVDAMYRMKMYFEDAGKWAFMKNMGMPGSIADELRETIARGIAAVPAG